MSTGGNSYGQGRRTRRILLMQAVVALGSGRVLHAAVDASTWRAYQAVEESWIRDRHELLIQEAPTVILAAQIDLEVRLADLRKRAMEFEHIASRDASLLSGGIWQMVSLPLTPQCRKELGRAPQYRQILAEITQLADSLRRHPQYPYLQHAQMRLWKTPQYVEAHRRYTGRMQELQRTCIAGR